MSIVNFGKFDLKTGNWAEYVARIESYFKEHEIPDKSKLPILLSVVGDETHDLLYTVANPIKPSLLEFDEAVCLIKDYLQSKHSIGAYRYKFRNRNQLRSETIEVFVKKLEKMSSYCDFQPTVLEKNLLDQFISGMKCEFIRQRLMSHTRLNYSQAVALAIEIETSLIAKNMVHFNSERKLSSELPGGNTAGVHVHFKGCNIYYVGLPMTNTRSDEFCNWIGITPTGLIKSGPKPILALSAMKQYSNTHPITNVLNAVSYRGNRVYLRL